MLLDVAGRLGRSALQPFIERATESGRRSHWALTEPTREAIRFCNTLLAPLLSHPEAAASPRGLHVLLHTDASTWGLGVLMGDERAAARIACAQAAARIAKHAPLNISLLWESTHHGQRAGIGCVRRGGLRTREEGRGRHLPDPPLG